MKRLTYNNGFKEYYYKCDTCSSEEVLQKPSGGFSPPDLICNSCNNVVTNNPLVIKYNDIENKKSKLEKFTNELSLLMKKYNAKIVIEKSHINEYGAEANFSIICGTDCTNDITTISFKHIDYIDILKLK